MTSWNYRILDHGTYRALHEVHYDDECRPVAYTSNPIRFCVDPDDADDAIPTMLEMALADAKYYPVLDVRVFKLSPELRPVAPRRNKE